MLSKGIRGNFEPLIDWISEIMSVRDMLTDLILADPSGESLTRLFNLFKLGIVSRDYELARRTCRLYSMFTYCLLDRGAHDQGYKWFTSENGLLKVKEKFIRYFFWD